MSNNDASSGAAMYDTMPMGDGEPWDRQSGELQEKWKPKEKKPKRSRLQKIVVWGPLFLFALVAVVNILPLFFKEAAMQVLSVEMDLVEVRDFIHQCFLQVFVIPGYLLKKIPLEVITFGLHSSISPGAISGGAVALTTLDISACLWIVTYVRRRFKSSNVTDTFLRFLILLSGLGKFFAGVLFVLLLFWVSPDIEALSKISYNAYTFCTLLFFVYLFIGVLQNQPLLKWLKLILLAGYIYINTVQGVIYYQRSVDIVYPDRKGWEPIEMEAQPSNIENLCAIFEEKPHWYLHASAAAKRHHLISMPIIMAIMYQESSFKANERNGSRPENTAYGYPQAIQPTWESYMKSQKRPNAKRYKFEDSVDFIAWITRENMNYLNIKFSDAYHLYLAYHEGSNRYGEGEWKSNKELKEIAASVQKNTERYERQLKECEHRLVQ